MRTHIRNMKRHHKANADYSQNIFFKSCGWERRTLRAGYIWAIIKASLFLLLYSFLTFMCGWLYKYYDLWILPWLPAWLLIIIPKFFTSFCRIPSSNIFFCCLIKIFVTLWELVMILWTLRVATSKCRVSRVAVKKKIHFVISDDDVSESVQEVNDIS